MDGTALTRSFRIGGSCFGLFALLPCVMTLANPVAGARQAEQARQAVEPFEVASIRPSGENGNFPSFQFLPGGVFRAENATLNLLIQVAYDIRPDQIGGGDKWTDSERFDVIAKPAEDVDALKSVVPNNVTLKRLQMLLSDRFALSLNRRPKMAWGYMLTVDKTGPKMTMTSDPGPPLITQVTLWQIKAEREPMSLFASFLSYRLRATVVDKTGLEGRFNFGLKWTSRVDLDQSQSPLEPNDDFDPAVIEQLGLRLQRERVESDSYVIARADRPTAN